MTLTHESETALREALRRRSDWLEANDVSPVAASKSPTHRRLAPIALTLVASALAGGALVISLRGHTPATVSTSLYGDSSAGSIASSSPADPGSEPTQTTISSAQSPTTVPPGTRAFTDADIPPREGPGDSRSPIQRYLGVPADPALAAAWENEHVQAATSECMAAKGFKYVPSAGDGSAEVPSGYSDALYGGGDYAAGCEAQASNRVHALNGVAGGLEEIVAAVEAEPVVIAARSASAACIETAGYDPTVSAPSDVTAFCSADLVEVIDAASEIAERAFMDRHYDYFVAFKSDLPTIGDPASPSNDTLPAPSLP